MSPADCLLMGQESRNLPISDRDVVRRVRVGQVGLFEVLMRRYNQRLYRVTRAILRDDAEAEAVMQQAYVYAYRHLDRLRKPARFSTWLTRITVREALARARRRMGQADEKDGGAMSASKSPGTDPEQQPFDSEVRTLIESAIDALPEHYRAVFVMGEVERMSTAESAECLDITEETAKVRLHRARMLLGEELYRRAGIQSGAVLPFNAPRCDRIVAAVLDRIVAIGPIDEQQNLSRPH